MTSRALVLDALQQLKLSAHKDRRVVMSEFSVTISCQLKSALSIYLRSTVPVAFYTPKVRCYNTLDYFGVFLCARVNTTGMAFHGPVVLRAGGVDA